MHNHLAAWSLAAGTALAMLATATFSSPARAERPLLFHSDQITDAVKDGCRSTSAVPRNRT
jgi:hypothetical protein